MLASLVFIASGLVDSLDGLLARYQNRVTAFGAFLDSTLDRLAEGVIIGAIGITLAQDGDIWGLAACFVALTASFMVSYARARAEGLGIPGSSGGLMGRPERLVIVGAALFLGSVGDVLPVGMAILAGLSLMTALPPDPARPPRLPVSRPLRIALVSPLPSPPRDDVARHVAGVARALAARGHGVTVLAPATTRDRIAAGRRACGPPRPATRPRSIADPGEVREVAIGRALPAGPGRRVGGPFDLVSAIEAALSRPAFDVVDLHEPLAPSPALAALRHARGVAAVTFHRAEPLAGVALPAAAGSTGRCRGPTCASRRRAPVRRRWRRSCPATTR